MSVVVNALVPHMVQGLFDVHGAVDDTIDDLLGKKGAFYPAFDGVQTWTFDFRVSEPVRLFLAGDCTRFACAAFQTFARVPEQLQSEELPWALIKAYYSAFYSAHAITRVLGATCTFFEGPRVTMLRQLLNLYGLSVPSFGGGLYWATVSPGGSAVDLRCISTQSGGSHELFWREFSGLIKMHEQLVLNGLSSSRQAAWDCLSTLRSTLTKGGMKNDSWLSKVRNDVQYKHIRGVWFHALEMTKAEQNTLRKIAEGWRGDPASMQLRDERCGELSVFVAACAFLVGLCRALVIAIEQQGRRGQKRSFAFYGPMRFLKQQQL